MRTMSSADITTICFNSSGALTGTRGATTSAASAMTITIGGTKTTSDTLNLLEGSVEWVAK